MRRWLVLLLLVTACFETKHIITIPEKCNLWPGHAWRYDHTEYWDTQEPEYGYHYDWYKNEYVWGQTGTRTVHHQRDIYSCQTRR